MPLYTFTNKDTNESIDVLISVSERTKFLEENPNFVQPLASPSIGDSVRLGVTKPPASFNELLNHAKKSHYKSNINTFN